ncbi:MAG TPA: cbb3-type cytochrome c oxidase subunit I, partial [Leifsonia sp.]|nr:cbb3-type cytochrome c oxidase subunit I [Leifsonia sp.]
MTTTAPAPAATTAPAPKANPLLGANNVERKGNILVNYITSTDHKTIGYMYLISSFIYFLIGGVMALIIRAQLFEPGLQVVQTKEQYNQLFTMHGTIMLLMFATPLFAGFVNVLMPLQIGAPDVAFPRLNALAYWFYSFGSLIAVAGFLTPQGAASFGWFAYAPLSSTTFSPGVGGNLWVVGLALSGFGTILGAVNFITTIITMRAPGMTMFRMPIFTWNALVTSILVLMAFPVLAAALFGLAADRVFDAHIYDAANGGALLWQHLFWFFGHPEVYIIALPFFGIVSEIFPVFSRKPVFGYKTLIYATISIAALSVTVWAHHMYVTGSVLLPWFSLMTMLIAVPTG